MRSSFVETSRELGELFERLVRDVRDAGCAMALGADGPLGPYVQIRSAPERRLHADDLTASSRTTIRLYPYETYLRYLDNTFPRLYDDLISACRPGRPFLVVEGWLRYIELGKRLLSFARERGLNLRCVDYRHGESRLNGVRVFFDHTHHKWRVTEGSVEDLLRDPRNRSRSWIAAFDPRWRLGRTATWLNDAARRAASVVAS